MLIIILESFLFVKMDIVQDYSHLDHLFQTFVFSSGCEKELNLPWKCCASASTYY